MSLVIGILLRSFCSSVIEESDPGESVGVISPQLALTVLDIRQQVTKKHPHPGRLLWVPGSIDSKHRDASADLLQGQESTLKDFCGGNGGSEGGHRQRRLLLSVPTGIHQESCEICITGKNQSSRREWSGGNPSTSLTRDNCHTLQMQLLRRHYFFVSQKYGFLFLLNSSRSKRRSFAFIERPVTIPTII
jgi:hypothetical protein